MTSDATTARIVGLAKLAGIDCDDVRLKQIKPGDPMGWTAELVHKGKDVENVDSELGLTTTQALDRLRHVVDALARARLKVLSAKAALARTKANEAWGADRAAFRAANEAALALTSLDPATVSTKLIEARLREARAASAACDAAHARWQSLTKLGDRAERERERAEDAYHELQSRA